MPLGTEVGLDPGDIVSDGAPAALKGAQPPVYGPCIVLKRLDGSRCHLVRRTKVGLGPDEDPAPPPQKKRRGHRPQFLAPV